MARRQDRFSRGGPTGGRSSAAAGADPKAGPSDFEPSPVPADANLAPGELPFTAWGQFGEGSMDLRVFDQDVYWVDQHGQPNRLDEMSTDYLSAVRGFLRRKADHFFASVLRRGLMSAIVADLSDDDRQGCLELWKETAWLLSQGAEPWLEQTALMRSINRRLESGHPQLEGPADEHA